MAFAEGGVYNPYRAPLNKDRDRASRDVPAAANQRGGNSAVGAGEAAGNASESMPERERQTARSYTPPTYGNWNPDPWGSGGSR